MTQATKTAIITGGNAGLGYETAKAILGLAGWHVVLACRDQAKATAAVDSLKAETGNGNVTAMGLDLEQLGSVRGFVETFSQWQGPPLKALICNAGLQIVSGTRTTKDGFETTFQVNYLSHFLLCNLLVPRMAAPGRILIVSSGTHDPANKTGLPEPRYESAELVAHPGDDPKHLEEERENAARAGRRRYTTSKLLNIYSVYELAERLVDKAISVNAFDPGMMPGTGLAREYPAALQFIWKYILPVLTLFPNRSYTPAQSGRALAALATDPAMEKVTGKYFEGTKEIPSSPLSMSTQNRRDLWAASVRMAKLKADEEI